jgi:hypothetical protein
VIDIAARLGEVRHTNQGVTPVMRKFRLMGLLGVASLLSTLAFDAQAQESLYGPQPPKGSAYVRIVNALGQPIELKPDFRSALKLGIKSEDRISSYDVVESVAGKALKLSFTVGGKPVSGSAQAEPDGFLTILIEPDAAAGAKMVGVTDLSSFNQNRTRLSFYNAIPGCDGGQLTLVPGGQAVFADVAAGASKARAVNPVTTQIAASCALGAAAPVQLEGLEAGGMVSVYLLSDGSKPTSFVAKDVLTPYHH